MNVYPMEVTFRDADGTKSKMKLSILAPDDGSARAYAVSFCNGIKLITQLQIISSSVTLKSFYSNPPPPAIGSDPLKSAHAKMVIELESSNGAKTQFSLPGPLQDMVKNGNMVLDTSSAEFRNFLNTLGASIASPEGTQIGTTPVATGKLQITGRRDM